MASGLAGAAGVSSFEQLLNIKVKRQSNTVLRVLKNLIAVFN
jgi:hypothetical protein